MTSGVVRPVNYNCPGQPVIAGEKAALAEAIENCKAAGARRALPRLRYPVHSIPR